MTQIPASYHFAMARALPGQVSDTSAYNIDGACILDDGDILVGVAVQIKSVDSMGHKIMKPMAAEGTPYGVAIRSHFQTISKDGRMCYEAGGGINVMTSGRVWMVSEDAQAQTCGAPVKLDEDGAVNANGAIETRWTYTGDYTMFGTIKLAEVQLK
ncbi:TPA: hypothetical protein H1940_004744 [Salmonella enterica]|nr:hypothetical protein [Salmonella enterica]